MKIPRFLPLLLLTVAFPFAEAYAQSQSQMNQEEYARFEKADANLNKIYVQLLAKLDAEGKAKLRAAQRAWVIFRDAQADLEADLMRGGSAASLLHSGSMKVNTERRIADLKQMLDTLGAP
jgi:uncharacterized protein YecT (DUF1311 family)